MKIHKVILFTVITSAISVTNAETLKSGSLYCKDIETYQDMMRAIVHENRIGIQHWSQNGCSFLKEATEITIVEKDISNQAVKIILSNSQKEAIVGETSITD